MTSRDEQAKWASKLQNSLGKDYEVHFDALDSGMTEIQYKHSIFKKVPNEEMCGSMNVYDYKAPFELVIAYM